MTRAEQRVLDLLADGDWHAEDEIRSSRATLERLWLSGAINGAMHGVGAYPEHRLWRLGQDPYLLPTDPPAGQARQAPDERHGTEPDPRPTPEPRREPAPDPHPSSASCSD